MTLRIHDTRTGKKVPFQPIVPGQVSLYACGTTVYDLCHIGHARKEVAWDVFTRHLRASGYALRFVRNITDVDDKIINKAKEEKSTADAVARKYTEEMQVDFRALGLATPDLEPRATEHIAEVIDIIRRLEEKGLA
jgi:cysteinyl-tRNA synthetase